MMKMILFASALALSTAAIAQDTAPAPATPPADPGAATPAAPAAQMPPPADASGGGMAPAASGGASSGPGSMSSAQQAASSTDDSNLPKCGKGVTDKCKQPEGGSGGGKHAAHHATKHKK